MATRAQTHTTPLASDSMPIAGVSAEIHTAAIEPPSSTPFLCRRPVRLSLYAFLVLALLLMLGWRFLPGLLDPTFQKHIQSKQVMVGMSREQVLQAWGSPYQTNITHTNEGIRREEWIYEDWQDAANVKHRYLYFEEGVLIGGWYN